MCAAGYSFTIAPGISGQPVLYWPYQSRLLLQIMLF